MRLYTNRTAHSVSPIILVERPSDWTKMGANEIVIFEMENIPQVNPTAIVPNVAHRLQTRRKTDWCLQRAKNTIIIVFLVILLFAIPAMLTAVILLYAALKPRCET